MTQHTQPKRGPRLGSITLIATAALGCELPEPRVDVVVDACEAADPSSASTHDLPSEPDDVPSPSPAPPPDDPPPSGLDVVDFRVATERGPDGGTAHIADLRWRSTLSSRHGRAELTSLPGRGALLSVVIDGRLAIAVVAGDGPRPAPFHDVQPRAHDRRPHAERGPVDVFVDPLALLDAELDDFVLVAESVVSLRTHLASQPCADCVEVLDDLAWHWRDSLRSTCRGALGTDAATACYEDVWRRGPANWR